MLARRAAVLRLQHGWVWRCDLQRKRDDLWRLRWLRAPSLRPQFPAELYVLDHGSGDRDLQRNGHRLWRMHRLSRQDLHTLYAAVLRLHDGWVRL